MVFQFVGIHLATSGYDAPSIFVEWHERRKRIRELGGGWVVEEKEVYALDYTAVA